jgi:Dyp-type peroxidase family
MSVIAFDDIQGIILRGYKELIFARFVLFGVTDPESARGWLSGLPVTRASDKEHDIATNVALTWDGLSRLGLGQGDLDRFAVELREGMSKDAQRQRALGDVGKHAPEKWQWGGPSDAIHGVILLYAVTREKLAELEARVFEGQKTGVAVLHKLESRALQDGAGLKQYWFREHFGFRDGVAQPRMAVHSNTSADQRRGVLRQAGEGNTVAPGEFLFGYANEYGKDPDGAPESLRNNGSFLVIRQIEQDVFGFWQFVRDKAHKLDVSPILLASKMVGRWPNGAPLVRAPREETAGLERFDAFGYAESDPDGHACPFGAHIRRANPRDVLVRGERESAQITKTHRLIRRGRSYGDPIHDPLDPSLFLPKLDALASTAAAERGLHFLCFNTSIKRQFEFVQQTWINSPKFMGQHDSSDPITSPLDGGAFELPGAPARRRVTDMRSFIRIRGGAYFFMPGLRALRKIAELRP